MSLKHSKVQISLALCFALIVSILLFNTISNTDPPGYCKTQNRFITDEDFISASIKALTISRGRILVFEDGRRVEVKDERKIDFDPRNSNCCLVKREKTYDFYNRLYGTQEVEVWLNPYTSTRPVTPSDYTLHFYFTVCGNLKYSDVGIPDNITRVISTTKSGEKHGL